MRKAAALFVVILALVATAPAQTGWNYTAGQISPMTDVRTDYLILRSSQPFKDHTGAMVFGSLIVECSAGGDHPVRFASDAHLDVNTSMETHINVRFGDDKASGLFHLQVERDGTSMILPSTNDATALKLASYDRLRLQIQVHGQPDQILEFAISGLRNIGEVHGCPLLSK